MGKCGVKILWLGILLSLTAVLASALISADILLYLAPRMLPMVWFGVVVLAGLCVYEGYETVQCYRSAGTTGKAKLGMMLFLVPIVFIITTVPNSETPASLPNQNVRMVSLAAGRTTDQADSILSSEDVTEDGTVPVEFLPCVLEDEHSVFNPSSDRFADYLYETADALAGRTITVYGFVYYDDSFPENTILVSRMMITCCAADAATVGFHVQVEPETALVLNEWIRVTGTVRVRELPYYGSYYDFPVLTDGLIIRCDAPDIQDAYIYP